MEDEIVKKVMFKGSPDLGDGVTPCVFRTLQDLFKAIDAYMADHRNAAGLEGDEVFSIRLIAMSDDEYNELPEL